MNAPVAGDPPFHIHHFLFNVVATDDGRIGSLDTKALSETQVREVSAYFQAVLADELPRLGVQIRYDARDQAIVVERIPEAVSKGPEQILGKAKALSLFVLGRNFINLTALRAFQSG